MLIQDDHARVELEPAAELLERRGIVAEPGGTLAGAQHHHRTHAPSIGEPPAEAVERGHALAVAAEPEAAHPALDDLMLYQEG